MPSSARVRWAKFRVLCVGLVSLSIMVTLFYLLTGGTLFATKSTVYLYVPDATGLVLGSVVRVDGITVGKLTGIALSGSNEPLRTVKLTIHTTQRSLKTIPVDSEAQVSADSPVGDRIIAITSGRSRETLKPNGEIRFANAPDLLKSLDMQQFEDRLRVVDRMLTNIEQGSDRVGQFVRGDQVYQDLKKKIGQIQEQFHAATSVTSAFGRELYGDAALQRIRAPILELDQSLARLQSGQGAGLMLRDSAQYDSLAASMVSLRNSVAQLRGSEFMASDQMYTGWEKTVDNLSRSVDAFNASPMMATSQMYDSLNGSMRELATTLSDLRQNPKKYLRLKLF